MTTALFYLVVAAVIGLVVFFAAVFVFGRGEQMAPLDPRTSPAELPDHDITAEDVRKIRFALALRGYRMSDVDWTLERLGEQIDDLRRENHRLRIKSPRADSETPQVDDLTEVLTEGDRVPVGVAPGRLGSSPASDEPPEVYRGERPPQTVAEPAPEPGSGSGGPR